MTDPQQPGTPPDNVPPSTQPPVYNTPPVYSTPPAPAYDTGGYGGAPAARPGRTLGIVAFVLSFFMQLIALILGIVALVQSRKAGQKNGFALAAIIISAVAIVIGAIVLFAVIIPGISLAADVYRACEAVDFSGSVDVNGVQAECTPPR